MAPLFFEIMEKKLDQLYIRQASTKGEQFITQNEPLREALAALTSSPRPETERIPGARFLGAGKYSFTYAIEGTAVKISSPTSSQESFDTKKPAIPEDLELQYEVMSALHSHLLHKRDITAPEQLFVARTPDNAFILGQELMQDWVSVEGRTLEEYGSFAADDEKVRAEVRAWTEPVRKRLKNALGGFSLKHYINDLGLDKPDGIHGGNLLVPQAIELGKDMPLCIIDQPSNHTK